jgi:cell division protein FtsX
MKTYLKILLACQFAVGLLLIISPLNALPNIRIVAEEPADITTVIEALHNASPTPTQVQRAAKLLSMQRDTLSSLTSSAEIASRGIEYAGVFVVLFGVILLIGNIKRNDSPRVKPE